MNNEERWKQRFQNFEKAYEVFRRRIDEYEDYKGSEAHEMALIQGFEMVVELAWKILKDYLENQGYEDLNTPKKVIRQAFQSEVITEGEAWMEALNRRNITSHAYNAEVLEQTLEFINENFQFKLQQMRGYLLDELNE